MSATHIVGGELNYKCLGNNNYEISLTVFRDCYNGNPAAYFDDPASVGIFDIDNERVTAINGDGQILMALMEDDTLDPTLFDSCLVIPPDVCVHTTTYRQIINLPPIAGGYQLAYQRCCRNQTILNIVDPLATGATYYNYISEKALNECNSSAVFKEWPPNYICADAPIFFDHSAVDIDGDSLVYKLCTPFEGADQQVPMPQPPNLPPYDSITWLNPPYSLEDMMGGVPLSIDPVTGLLTGTPNTVGQFVVGICVEEYRNGELISTTKRDFQYNVGICGEVISSFFNPAVDCDGFTVDFDNQSQDANQYYWDFGDPNTTNDFSTLTNPSYTYPDTGLYEITLIAGPNEVCSDTSYSTVYVQIPSLFVDFDLSIIDGCVFPAEVSFDDLSFDTLSTIVAWDWEFSDGTSSTDQDPVWYLEEPGNYIATLTATAENGCQVSHTDFISIDVLELGLQDSAKICVGDQVVLNPGSNPSYTYQWSSGQTLSNAQSPSPTASPPETTTYYVTVNDLQGCQYVDSVIVDVNDLNINFDDEFDICVGDTIQLHNGIYPNYTFNWSPNIDIINNNSPNPLVFPSDPITYYVTVVDNETGCIIEDSVKVKPIILDEIPLEVTDICIGNSVFINPNPNLNYQYSWSPSGSLNDATLPNPEASPSQTTIYTVEVLDANTGCIREEEVQVIVNPLPEVPLDTVVSCSGNPVEINPLGNPNYTYQWSPAGGLDNPNIANPTATVSNTTTYNVTFTDNNNCQNTSDVVVFIPPVINAQTSDDEVSCETNFDISSSSNTGVQYDWYDDINLNNNIGNGQMINVSPGESTTYYVVVMDDYGCTDVAEVTVGSRAVNVIVDPEVLVCENDSFQLQATNLNPNDIITYDWEPDEYIVLNDNTDNPTIFLADDDIISLYVENQFGCSDIIDIPVDVVENDMDVIAAADPDSIYPGETSQLDATFQNGYTYVWNPDETLNDILIQNPIASPEVTTLYEVIVTNEIGCQDTAQVIVHLKSFFCEEPYLFIPNAFTPDGDNVNDVFYVRGNAVDEIYMAVYNRWGELVFETNDLNIGWDGTYKGKALPPDVFGYYVEIKCLNGEEFFKKGNVTIIR